MSRSLRSALVFSLLALATAAGAASPKLILSKHPRMLPRKDVSAARQQESAPSGCDDGTSTNCADDHMTYYGGNVIPNAKIYLVFWKSTVDSKVQASMGNFYKALVNSDHMDWMNEYNTNISIGGGTASGSEGTDQLVGRGVYAGAYTLTTTNTSKKLTDAAIATELDAQITAGHLPQPDANTLYMIHFPAAYIISLGTDKSCSSFCAYHSTYTRGTNQSVYYGVIPSQTTDGCQNGCGDNATDKCGTTSNSTCSTSSHEVFEAISDAEVGLAGDTDGPPLSWYNDQGGEIGDMCLTDDAITGLDTKTWAIQQIYSNKQTGANQCVTTRYDANDFKLYMDPNFVTLAAGSTLAVPITFAQTAGSIGSVMLTVSGLPSGVTAQLDHATVSPSNTGAVLATLTLTAAADAALTKDAVVVVEGLATAEVHTAGLLLQVTGGVATADFTVSVPAATTSIAQGGTGTVTVTTATSGSGAAPQITLSATGLPSGVTASFSPATVAAGSPSTMTLTATSGATVVTAQTYTVTGTAGSNTHTTTSGKVTVTASTTPVADFSVSLPGATASVAQSSATTVTVTTATVGSGSAPSIALTASGLPTGVTASFSPATVTAGGSSTLTLSASASAPTVSAASYTVTGTAGSTTHTANGTVTVTATSTIADFSVTVPSAATLLIAGSTAGVSITSAVVGSGTAPSITYTVSGLPSGVTGSFAPNPVAAGSSSTLTLSATSGAAAISAASYTVTGTAGTTTHTGNGLVTVQGKPTLTLSSPADGATLSGNFTIRGSAVAGAGATLSSVTVQLDGTTQLCNITSGSFAPFTCAWNTASALGSHSLLVTATDVGGGAATASANVTVVAPASNDFSISFAPTSATVVPGGPEASFLVTTDVTSGTAELVTFWVSGLPSGVSASFDPSTVTAGGTTTLTLTVAANAPHVSAKSFIVKGTTSSIAAGRDTTGAVTVESAPTIAFTAPAAGTVSGTVSLATAGTVDANATIASVDLFDGATQIGSDTSATTTVSWDTTTVADGPHTLTAKITDSNGASATSAALVLTVSNASATSDFTLTLASSSASADAGSTATFTVNTTAIGAADSIALTVSGLATGVTASFSPSTVTAGGSSTLTLTAASSAAAGTSSLTITGTSSGNTHTAAATFEVTVPASKNPTVKITAPFAGETLSGSVTVTATATATTGASIARVDFFSDGVKISSASSEPYSISWDTTTATAGAHSLTAEAIDSGGRSTTSKPVSVTVTQTTTTPPVSQPLAGGCTSFGGAELGALFGLLMLVRRKRSAAIAS